MKCIDLIASFELEINKLDDALDKPVTDDSIYWINQAVMKFVKDRFNGNAPKRTSYEQNEKRTRDLINLLVNIEINADEDSTWKMGDYFPVTFSDGVVQEESRWHYDNSHYNYDSYECNYPDGMLYVLNEDVIISDLNDEHLMDTCVFECTADNFMYRINNSLTDFHYRYHRARPLRIRTKDGFKLLTDKKYKIHKYSLGYLKVPTEIKPTDPYAEYTDFEDNIWMEIIKIAAQMYIENQADPRYNTISQEVLTQE